MKKQTVLKTTERDIMDFYVGVLGGKITKHFTLNVDESIRNLNIPQAQEVYKLKLQGMHFKLCPCEIFEEDSIQHVNLHIKKAAKMYRKASENKYWSHHKEIGGKEVYFVKDKHNNLFELGN